MTTQAPADDTRKNIEYSDDDPNLALTFPEEELKKISNKVIKEFDLAYDSTEKYRDRCAKNWAIFAGELPPKEFPYAEACNAHVPFMLETLTRLHARLSSEIFKDWAGPLHYTSTQDATDDQADLIEAHDAWQFREGIPDFRRQMNRALLCFLNQGDVTIASGYDTVAERNRHETLSVDEFVVPYTMTTTSPDWSDVPYTCRVLLPYKHELESRTGEWNGVEEVIKKEASWDDEPEMKVADTAAKTQGTEKDEDSRAPYKTIQYEGWMMLPGQTKHRFVKAVVHYESGTVFQLSIHEMPDWRDKQRFDRQTSEKAQYVAVSGQHQQAMDQAGRGIEQIRQHINTVPMDPMEATQMHGQLMQTMQAHQQLQSNMPQPPMWMDPSQPPEMQNPKEPKMVAIHLYAHAVAIEPLVGNLGLGHGRMLADYNRAGNTALSQYIDAATLSNCWGLITSDIVQFKEKFMVKPGFVNKVTGLSMAQVKDNIMELKAGNPSDALLKVVDMVGNYAQQVAQAPDVLSGEPGKSGETYRGISTRIDQAVKQMSYLGREFGQLVVQVGKNNMLLNSLFLKDEELFPFKNPTTKQGSMRKVTRAAYEQSYTVELRADLQFSPRQQKIQEANELMGIISGLPAMGIQLPPVFLYQALVLTLKSRELETMIPLLGAPPPPPQQFMPPPPPPPPGMMQPGPPGSTGKPATVPLKGPVAPPPPQPPQGLERPPGPGGAIQPQANT